MPDGLRTPYDDLPLEVQRANWGWFGDPWPSGVCYDDGRLRDEMRKPFPAGETCLYCSEPFAEGDQGQAMPSPRGAIRHVHKECLLRMVTGSIAHLEGRCRCHGGGNETPGLTLRQDALAVWEWTRKHGITDV